MIDRRKFLKRISGALVGFVGLLTMPPKKLPAKQKGGNNVVANGTDKVREWHDEKGYRREGTMDFPDTIVGTKKYHGKLLVFCKHSVWEIEEGRDGLQRKSLTLGVNKMN